MQIDISFAKPIGPYDNLLNRIPCKYCHVELSFHTTAELFRQMLVSTIDQSYDPQMIQELINRLRHQKGKIIVCFFINWGEKLSCRYLSDMIDDPYFRPPEQPVYDTLSIECDLDKINKITSFYLLQLGKPYDYMRAVLTLAPVTLRSTPDKPDKYFCSQVVMYSLREIGIECEDDINHMKPLDVYRFVKKHCINTDELHTNGSSKSSSESSTNGND